MKKLLGCLAAVLTIVILLAPAVPARAEADRPTPAVAVPMSATLLPPALSAEAEADGPTATAAALARTYGPYSCKCDADCVAEYWEDRGYCTCVYSARGYWWVRVH